MGRMKEQQEECYNLSSSHSSSHSLSYSEQSSKLELEQPTFAGLIDIFRHLGNHNSLVMDLLNENLTYLNVNANENAETLTELEEHDPNQLRLFNAEAI